MFPREFQTFDASRLTMSIAAVPNGLDGARSTTPLDQAPTGSGKCPPSSHIPNLAQNDFAQGRVRHLILRSNVGDECIFGQCLAGRALFVRDAEDQSTPSAKPAASRAGAHRPWGLSVQP